ncbi:hypothetical protein BHE74_00021115 [Ensete ventricosum]|uniref:Uncharacterized protein n=1 Tax=Ensete ventricosum TaxID=4639 RepID=A0A444CX98_ENSVE|nr:hypothetical protein GW17_00047229 [Ensete ventricosum]RWW71156.1 hypothetical protein BHE74_00021115 [Ensete ventricosum]RZR70628.1 hypothetical protein BHM03_00000887 [Ensete ventricosum]
MSLVLVSLPCHYSGVGSSSFSLRPRSVGVDGLGWALARKLSSDSLVNWSKDKTEEGLKQLYHIRAKFSEASG